MVLALLTMGLVAGFATSTSEHERDVSSQRAQARAYSYAQMGLEQFLTYRKELTCTPSPAKGYSAAQAAVCAFCPQCWTAQRRGGEWPAEREPRCAAHRGGVGDGHLHLGHGVRARRAGDAARRRQGHAARTSSRRPGRTTRARSRRGRARREPRRARSACSSTWSTVDDERDGRARPASPASSKTERATISGIDACGSGHQRGGHQRTRPTNRWT